MGRTLYGKTPPLPKKYTRCRVCNAKTCLGDGALITWKGQHAHCCATCSAMIGQAESLADCDNNNATTKRRTA